jgi:periplasmic divalent cation tolerance protein
MLADYSGAVSLQLMAVVTSQALLVLTTCANAEEAERLAAELVERSLAACVNTVNRIASTYRWQGKVEQAQESLLVIKTTEERFAALEKVIRERSSYELPEVLAIRIHAGSSQYLQWLGASVVDR